MKTRVLHKLLGGPRHGRRVYLDASQAMVNVPVATTPLGSIVALYKDPNEFVPYKIASYLQRTAAIGNNKVYYWAHDQANNAEAFEMLCNHLLRDTEIVT